MRFPKVIAGCKNCGKPYQQGWQNKKFCSRQCYLEHKAKRPSLKKRTCKQCSHEFERTLAALTRVKNGFCSRECWRLYLRQNGQHNKGKFERVLVQCDACGKDLQKLASDVKRNDKNFCNKGCFSDFYRDENSPMFRGDKDPNRGAKWNRLAESIRQRDNYTCRRCRRTQEENKQKLSVDHIVPWRNFQDKAKANDPSNLVSLCRKCHSWKTSNAERKWLKGDVIGFQDYLRSINAA